MRTHLLLLASLAVVACSSEKVVDPPNITTVNLSQAASFGLVGDSVQFTATVIDGNGRPVLGATVEWSSSNAAIATVSAAGYVTGRAVGEATITARTGTATSSLPFEVDPNPCTAPTAFAVGEVRRFRGATAFGCATLPAASGAQDFLYIVGNAKAVQDDTLTYTLSLTGTGASARVAPAGYGRPSIGAEDEDRLPLDVERRLRTYERSVTTAALPNTQRRGAGADQVSSQERTVSVLESRDRLMVALQAALCQVQVRRA